MDIPAFSDEELNLIRAFRDAEIRVTHDGRLTIWHTLSDEHCAGSLHKLLRPSTANPGAQQ